MAVKPRPDGYHAVTPYLVVNGAAQLIDFLKQVFNAQAVARMPGPDGRIGHAEMRLDDSMLMLGDACAEHPATRTMLYVYVDDVDATYQRAIAAGATTVREPADQFYGDRNAGVKDFAGNYWCIAKHVEDVAPEEMERRMAAAMAANA